MPHESDEERFARTALSSLGMSDRESAAVQKTPYRIALKMIRDSMRSMSYFNPPEAPHMTIAIAMLSNGYILVGKSTPADPGNFDAELGRKFAREDAERQAWPLFAFALREMLSDEPCLSPLTDVRFWAQVERPFSPTQERDAIAAMQERLGNPERHAALDPDDE